MAAMRRQWLRPFWTLLALLFLLEAWLWDHLEPLVARAVNLLPWGRLRDWIKRTIETLPPWAALFVFVVPFIVLLPLKFLEFYLLATQQWAAAVVVLVLAKLVGLGVTAFVFDATRDKLLQMAWFARMYGWFIWARGWAHAQTEPIRRQIKRMLRRFRARGGFFRRFARLRRRAHAQPAK